jgi:hypothetical protein
LGSWKHSEGYNTGNEGLEERGAEQGTIAGIDQCNPKDKCAGDSNLSKWYVAGFLNEYEAILNKRLMLPLEV